MTRQTIDLTGMWRAQPDVATEGEAEGWFAPDFDVRRWREVAVPSSFGQVAPGLDTYEGAVWYRRTFGVPAEWEGRRVVLRFEGANYHTTVWVNGCLSGSNRDGFLRFEVPVSEALSFGADSVVVVRVDGIRRQGEVPGMERGWQTFGGILREVALLASDPLRVEDVVLAADPSPEGGVLRWRARVENGRLEDIATDLTVSVLDADGRQLAQATGADGVMTVTGAVPWTPGTPSLYTARFDLTAEGEVVDSREVRFGFRRIEATDTGLLLNGEPVFLTGFNRHEDSPRTGMCTDLETVRRDLLAMKDLGCNFIRLCHYPHHPGELDLCDEIGLLVMGEIPLYWWNGLEEGEENSAHKLAAAKRQLTSMILRDRNHPSVIFWSVSNECREDRPEVVAGNDELVRVAKALDPSRLAVHVSCAWQAHPNFVEDDVVCINAYPTWRAPGGEPPTREHVIDAWTRQPARLRELYPDKPILVTEFGHPCFEGVFGTHMGEDAQAEAIELQFGAMTAPYICGATIWCWADHPWPQENFLQYVTVSPFGVVTRERRRLQGCRTTHRIFRERQGLCSGPASADRQIKAKTATRPNRPRDTGSEIALATLMREKVDRPCINYSWMTSSSYMSKVAGRDYWSDREGVFFEYLHQCGINLVPQWYFPGEEQRNIERGHIAHEHLPGGTECIRGPEDILRAVDSLPPDSAVETEYDIEAAARRYADTLRVRIDRTKGETLFLDGFGQADFMGGYNRWGYENYLIAIMDYPEAMRRYYHHTALGGRLLNQAIVHAREKYGIAPFVYSGQDICTRRGPIVSPQILRDIYFPELKWAIQPLIENGIGIIWHCDGNITPVLDDIMGLGVVGLQGFEEEHGVKYDEIVKLRDRTGRSISVWGCVSVTTILPHGSVEDVKSSVERSFRLAGRGRGFVLSSTSSIMPEVPHENIHALFQHGRDFGTEFLSQ